MAKTAEQLRAEMSALQKQLEEAEAAEAKAAQAGNAKRAVSLLYAMRSSFRELEALFPGSFDQDKWSAAFTAQAWPRPGRYARVADLSETEVHAARDAGEKVIAGLK